MPGGTKNNNTIEQVLFPLFIKELPSIIKGSYFSFEEEYPPVIRISNVFHRFGERMLFSGLFWTVPPGSKVGLVGSNGAGKTTLLRALTGTFSLDSGTVETGKNEKIGYLPQDLVEIPDMDLLAFLRQKTGLAAVEEDLAVCTDKMASLPPDSADHGRAVALHDTLMKKYEALDGYAFDAMAGKVLKGLGFSDADLGKSTETFSGGWKMRIHLAGLLLAAPDILLLDEPTNHLDSESMEWLEGWLSSFRGIMVAVSHDRRFLDRLCTSVAELYSGKITVYSGNFSAYLEERERRLEELRKTRRLQQEEISRMEDFIRRFRYKASKASSVQSRVKRLEKMSLVQIEEESKRVSFRFPPCTRTGLDVLTLSEGEKRYGAHAVFRNASLTIRRGEKIALVGVNGAGKSTLSRILAGKEPLSSGSVRLGHQVKLGFYSQESSENLDYDKTVWQTLSSRNPAWTEQDKRNLLGAFLFSGDDIHKPVSILSGGEKSRLALLKLLLEEANFLILDEPTNHLDMQTRDLFQRALLEYDGTLVIVSHDRYFLDNLATKVVEIAAGSLREYPGNYSWFIEKRKSFSAGEERELSRKDDAGSFRDQKRIEAEQRNDLYRRKKILLDRLEPLEKHIEDLESLQQERDGLLADPLFLSDSAKTTGLLIERKETSRELEKLLALWDELVSEINSIEKTG